MSTVPNCYVVDLTNDGQGRTTLNLGQTVVTLITRWNASAKIWTLDILDSNEDPVVVGIAMVPGVNLLKPYPSASQLIGSLVVAEKNSGGYQNSDLLGNGVILLWFPLGITPILPMPVNFTPTQGS